MTANGAPPPVGDPWPFSRSPAPFGDPIAQSMLLILVASAVFVVWPGIDLWFAGLFFHDRAGFAMRELDAFTSLRGAGTWLVLVPVLAMAAAVAIKLVLPARRTLLEPRTMLFVFSTLVVGPGLLVNALFKPYSGRPRPYEIVDFGGAHPFVGAWDFSGACTRNCSFISGEASAALWTVTLAMFLPRRWRPAAVTAILVLVVLLSLNRIAFGGHFLSDVLISWGFTLLVITVFHRVLYRHPPAALTAERLEDGLTGFGNALRRLPRSRR